MCVLWADDDELVFWRWWRWWDSGGTYACQVSTLSRFTSFTRCLFDLDLVIFKLWIHVLFFVLLLFFRYPTSCFLIIFVLKFFFPFFHFLLFLFFFFWVFCCFLFCFWSWFLGRRLKSENPRSNYTNNLLFIFLFLFLLLLFGFFPWFLLEVGRET